jgi:hypothetical protein
VTEASPEADQLDDPAPFRPLAVYVAVVYVASRLLTMLAAATVATLRPGIGLTDVLLISDGGWYLQIAESGYDRHIVEVGGVVQQTNVAFFPLFPLTIRVVDAVLPGGAGLAAVAIALVGGLVATLLFALLVRRWWGEGAARRAALLFAFFPGSLAFSMAYSEGLMLALAIGCLLLLADERWLLAGVAGGLATAARPTAAGLIAACAAAALVAARRDRDPRPFVAPVLAASGILGYFAFLWHHTGDALAWFHAEEGWGQDFGFAVLESVGDLFDLSANGDDVILTAGLLFLVAALVFLIVLRPPAMLVAYSVTLVALLLPALFGTVPRYLLVAFPLLVPFAVRWSDRHTGLLAACFAGGLVLLPVYMVPTWFDMVPYRIQL